MIWCDNVVDYSLWCSKQYTMWIELHGLVCILPSFSLSFLLSFLPHYFHPFPRLPFSFSPFFFFLFHFLSLLLFPPISRLPSLPLFLLFSLLLSLSIPLSCFPSLLLHQYQYQYTSPFKNVNINLLIYFNFST